MLHCSKTFRALALVLVLVFGLGAARADEPPGGPPPDPGMPEITPPAPPPLPQSGEIILSPGLGGRLVVVDANGQVATQLDKPAEAVVPLALPPGEYRVVLMGEGGRPVALAFAPVPAGGRVAIGAAEMKPLAAPAKPRDRYPRSLAARPLTLPGRVVELGLIHDGIIHSEGYNPFFDLVLRFSITDRLEIRSLGVYYALLASRGRTPDLGAGVALTGIGFSSVAGLQLQLTSWLDLRQPLGSRAAIVFHGRYVLTINTNLEFGIDHALRPGIEILVDVAPFASLFATGDWERRWLREPLGDGGLSVFTTDEVWPQLGVHVALSSWMELRAAGGPAWLRVDEGPFVLRGRVMGQVRIRF